MQNDIKANARHRNSNLYEFQGWDKFFRLVRGNVEADSKSGARKIIRDRSIYLPIIWLHGEEPLRVRYLCQLGGYIEQCSPELELKWEDGNYLIYATRNLPRIVISTILILIGIGLISYCVVKQLDILETTFIPGIGIFFIIVGGLIIFRYLELKVDKQTQQISIRMRIAPGIWRERQVDASITEKVTFRRETFYMSERATVYIVSLDMKDQRIQIDASSDKEREFKLGQKLAEYLELPFVSED